MAKESMKAREVKRAKLVARYAEKRAALKKIIDVAINEISAICGQKAVATYSKKDIANFKLRKKMPIGVMVTLRRDLLEPLS